MTDRIYLDFNATATTKREVIQAVADAMAAGGNASSIHGPGRAARNTVEDARGQIASLVAASPGSVVFTASGTEANNQALRCSGRKRIIVSSIEHESVLQAVPDPTIAPVDGDGVIDLDALARLLEAGGGDATLVSVMLANNETGVIQPMSRVVKLAHDHGALVHCDGVQAGGKIAVDMAALGVDSLSLAAHKMAGPQGIGALVLRDRTMVGRLVHGGGQEGGLRAGTESVPAIAGFGVAAALAARDLARFGELAKLRDDLESRVREIAPEVTIFGGAVPRLPNTAKFATPGLTSETQVMGLDLAGIAVSAGSACAAGKAEPPYVLNAMGVDPDLALCGIRVSLGWSSTAAHMDDFVQAWRALYDRAANSTTTSAAQ